MHREPNCVLMAAFSCPFVRKLFSEDSYKDQAETIFVKFDKWHVFV